MEIAMASTSVVADMIQSFQNQDFLDDRTMFFVSESTKIALGLASGLALLMLSFHYMKNALTSFTSGNEGKLVDPVYVGKILLIYFGILLYPSMVSETIPFLQSITNTFESSDADYSKLQLAMESIHEQNKIEIEKNTNSEIIKEWAENPNHPNHSIAKEIQNNQKIEEENDGGMFSGLTSAINEIKTLLYNPQIFVTGILHWVINLFVFIIREVVKLIAFFVLKLLIVIGPLALAFTHLFGNSASKWFSTTINVIMVFLVFNLLDAFLLDSMEMVLSAPLNYNMHGINGFKETGSFAGNVTANAGVSIQNSIILIGFDLAVISLYISAFWIAGKIVGTSDAGAIVGKSMQVATTILGAATTLTAGAMTLGAGAAIGGGAAAGGAAGGAAAGGGATASGGAPLQSIVSGKGPTIGGTPASETLSPTQTPEE